MLDKKRKIKSTQFLLKWGDIRNKCFRLNRESLILYFLLPNITLLKTLQESKAWISSYETECVKWRWSQWKDSLKPLLPEVTLVFSGMLCFIKTVFSHLTTNKLWRLQNLLTSERGKEIAVVYLWIPLFVWAVGMMSCCCVYGFKNLCMKNSVLTIIYKKASWRMIFSYRQIQKSASLC